MLSVQEKTIQERILGAWPPLGVETPARLLQALRNALLAAHGQNLLRTAQHEINQWVRLDPKVHPSEPEPSKVGPHIIVGGVKVFNQRDPESAHLVRDDGVWIHFSITVHWDGRKDMKLLGYDFEIVFPEGHAPRFLRIDLNPPGHANEAKELRSHFHPSNDDLQFPAPVMTPQEILHLFIHGLRPRHADKPRA
jgi:hypothetical protein